MPLTVSQSQAVATIIYGLTGTARTRAQVIDALVDLAGHAYQRMAAGYTPDEARAALEQRWPDLGAETWTDEDGHVWDLTVGYHAEATADAWAPIGWLAPFDGVPVPYLECRGLATDIETVIREFGPLTRDPADGA